jgi:hypothetical protein
MGSFPLKEQYECSTQARERAEKLTQAHYFSMLIEPELEDPTVELILANAIEVPPGKLADLCP